MRLSLLKLVVVLFALIALPLQALGAGGASGCSGATDAAMWAVHEAGDSHHGDSEGSHSSGAHSPLCGACPVAGSALPGASMGSGGVRLDDAPVRGLLHFFRSFSPEPDKRPPLASA